MVHDVVLPSVEFRGCSSNIIILGIAEIVKRNRAMVQQEIVDHYSQTGYESERLNTGVGRLEYARTMEVIQRYLSPHPLVILDVGGGAGAYSLWLAEMGHTVHLIDMVPRHIEIATERSRAARTPLASVEIGDARSLPYADGYADIVLLMGPLYHLVEREERLDALRENGRVLKRGGHIQICLPTGWVSYPPL
jgi:ubiquinone/menaquinone biosynthesis C-methylase UbiE